MMDLSKVPHVEHRRKLAAMHEEIDKLNVARDEIAAPFRARMDAAREEFRRKFDEALAPLQAESDAATKDLDAKIEQLNNACEEAEGPGLSWPEDGGEEPHRCAVTGLLVLEDDEIIKDEETGDIIIRAALPWPDQVKDAA